MGCGERLFGILFITALRVSFSLQGQTRMIKTPHLFFITLIWWVWSGPSIGLAEGEREFSRHREVMVAAQIVDRGITDTHVIRALKKVPRHLFVPEPYRDAAYTDRPLPIGEGQTISQPYIVAVMTEALRLRPGDRVLEIGTGSGYQAAVLAEIVKDVYSIEIVASLGRRAAETLKDLGYTNIHTKIGDGYKGWPQQAPFDAVIVTCAPEKIPPALIEQLKEGGRMMIPVGRAGGIQQLVRGVKRGGRLETEVLMLVRFVPMVAD